MSRRRRVAITGIGLVTPVGNDVSTTWTALLEGRSGVAPISIFDASGFSTRIAAEVKDFDAAALGADRKLLKFANRSHRFALGAAEQAMRDAGIAPTAATAARWGCSVGTGMMGVAYEDLSAVQRHSAADGELHVDRLVNDPTAADPIVFCRSQATAGLALLTRRFGIHGYATSVHTACASGGQAIGTALKLIRRGSVDYALAGGFDSMISPVGLGGFCLLSAVSADNDVPQRASRPFDATRNGFVLGEGAGFVVLEEWEAARRRGAPIYAELAGDGNSLSSYRITDSPPDGDGPIQSMRAALADAGAAPEDVDYINAHGTSTYMNDKSESAAIHTVFGDKTADVAVSSTKSSMGHLIAAAGAVEVVVCALAIRHGELPINANLRERDPDCDLNLVVAPTRRRVRMTLSNSFGFGGSNSCVALRHPDEVPDAA
ncbi:MAG TPA: beta-ketoacyl-[acyl-carrier-protein] synthase family protein [Casimicrobiaceae bacterium]|jgi:3-oxoacyl-(acyl-carrier-protein) synthase|nr:beta-ketoacyl-[acyl-carrier-protein] synthase family protein [Casimicrobiaceae bacterium]